MKDRDELVAEIQRLAGDKIGVMSIRDVNHKPHPYTIGPRHIGWASDHFSGQLSKEAIADGEKNGVHCAYPYCQTAFDEHTSDAGIFIQLNRDVTNKELVDFIMSTETIVEENKLAGYCFVENEGPVQFKVAPPIKDTDDNAGSNT